MGEVTGISWCDHTFNPWIGCTKVSPGCDNCYAETLSKRWGHANWGKGVPRRVMSDHYWNDPIRWDRAHAKAGTKGRVFCASMADVMDDEAPAGQRERLWALIDKTPNLIWQLLTKRPQRYGRYLPRAIPANVQLGITAEDATRFYDRWYLAREAARERGLLWWVSYEPALGPLRLHCDFCAGKMLHSPDICHLPDWIIFGGESGGKRRECDVDWAYTLRDDCRRFGVPLFVKQMSAPTAPAGKLLIPSDLQIQEFPA